MLRTPLDRLRAAGAGRTLWYSCNYTQAGRVWFYGQGRGMRRPCWCFWIGAGRFGGEGLVGDTQVEEESCAFLCKAFNPPKLWACAATEGFTLIPHHGDYARRSPMGNIPSPRPMALNLVYQDHFTEMSCPVR
jgi:hypothetical protein